MKHMKIEGSYLLEQPDDVILIDLNEIEQKPVFERKHIALIIGEDFNPLAETHVEVEGENKKEYTTNFNTFIIADTDINILNYIQNNGVHKSCDYSPIMRCYEIDYMYKLLQNDKPLNLKDNNGEKEKLFRSIILLVNFETRERSIVDIVFSEQQKTYDFFINEQKEKGLDLVISISPDNVVKYYEEFNRIEKLSGELDLSAFAYNKRNNYPYDLNDISEEIIGYLLDTVNQFEKDIYESYLRREIKGDHYSITLLNYLRDNIIVMANNIINEYEDVLDFDDNIKAIDFLTAGRLKIEHLNELNELIEKKYMNDMNFIENTDFLITKIDNLLKNFDIDK